MKQNISTLMDGELSGDEAEMLLGKIKDNPIARQEWATYHLIGDAMRQPDHIPRGLSASFAERLQAEPTVLAPRTRRSSSVGYVALSAVASIMAMAFLAWISVQTYAQPPVQQNPTDLRMANLPSSEGLNDYLLAHHEYSHSTDMHGASSYIQKVVYRQQGAGQ